MSTKELLKSAITKAIAKTYDMEADVLVEYPADESHGDYATNAALVLSKKVGKQPREVGEALRDALLKEETLVEYIDKIEIAGPGFINFYLSDSFLSRSLSTINQDIASWARVDSLQGKKIMVEYGHPNTHKEMHIGHMRTLIVGESLARILASCGATVFRANYQGDIGPHVAKAIWGTQQVLAEKGLEWDEVETWTHSEKAHLLGEGYIRGNKDYETHEEAIKKLNNALYEKDPDVMPIYQRTRQWSLDYYDELYTRFGTTYDKLYFESEVAHKGIQIVKDSVGTVFTKSDGAIIFDGEPYGLHKRVFITQEGYPTYEAKDIGLAPTQYADFAFDQNIHVVANEQKGYFEVVFKALSMLDPTIGEREYHLSMGMVNLKGMKMSSRTGVIITVDGLIENIREYVKNVINPDGFGDRELDSTTEKIALGAIKYSVLKVDPTADVVFDAHESVSLDGNNGPYLHYTLARARRVLTLAGEAGARVQPQSGFVALPPEEKGILTQLVKYPEIVAMAGSDLNPSYICHYLFALSQKFNAFYGSSPIIKAESQELQNLRLQIVQGVSEVLTHGINLLGLEFVERM